MEYDIIRRFMLAWVIYSILALILVESCNNPIWFDIVISVIIAFPIYIRVADRLNVEVM